MEGSGETDFLNENNTSNFTCEESIEMETFVHISLPPAVFIIIVLSCLERRLKRCCIDDKIPLHGHCGILAPFDILGYSNRWSLGFAFGIIADKVIYLFSTDHFISLFPRWAKVFVVLIHAVEVGVSVYPFFACLSTSYVITGSILGFLYTAAWMTITVIDCFLCPDYKYLGVYQDFIMGWPSLVCYLFLLGRFVYIFVKAIRVRCGYETVNEETSFVEIHQIHYVQRLLRKPLPQPPQKSWIRRKMYQWDPYFRFPGRMIATAVLLLVCLYASVVAEFIVTDVLFGLLKQLKTWLDELPSSPETPEESMSISDYIGEFITVAQVVWICTTVVSSVASVSYILVMLACYRKHIMKLRAGKKCYFLMESEAVPSAQCVLAVGRSTAYQIAYLLWGYVIMHLLQFVAWMIVMYLIVLPMVHGEWAKLLDKWGTVILSFVLIMILRRLELFAGSRVFLQPKISPKDDQRPLALDNRKAFANFSYFLFFHSVVVGLFSCLMRVLRSTALGAFLVGRLDRPVMPRGFEGGDKAFKSWVAMLLMDHYHSNPILVCFCHILDSKIRQRQWQKVNGPTENTDMREIAPRVSGRARKRWLLLYTLLNNPSLLQFQKRRLGSYPMDFPQPCAVPSGDHATEQLVHWDKRV
ncbi:stimulated by retinoic acid gene 6 protein-like [Zootoca vivipara]|uniref:stimulated by retinoic acid gene 6 protein-like n=1 Tax=Zootoca vivipara TaxID=8524 RepID=UPI00159045B3|nr:stimulated by retinoic acid gene 6 protein-like [Zootoca vivipara]XP_060124750.1 stimulated by retinoic acid gene 6 protein-like [Zootoca vivipara]